MPNKFVRYLGISIALILIICIRIFENTLFYDPLMSFFKSDYQNKPIPNFEHTKLIIHLFLRYFANTVLSISVIYFLFQNKMHVKIASVLYVLLFVFLISVLAYLLFVSQKPNYLLVFYVRRFLIQPVLILLLIPAFYFQTKAE